MSRILAIEWSTRLLSVALNAGPTHRRRLDRFHAPEALALLEGVLDAGGASLSEISEIRIGRGPGNYSGIRLAFAWAIGAAAPGGIVLRAYSSGAALARRILAADATPLLVLGDARRGMGWGAEFHPGFHRADWELLPPEVWAERARTRRSFSAEPERLPHIPGLMEAYPCASDLLSLDPDLSEPFTPLYLHPPVG